MRLRKLLLATALSMVANTGQAQSFYCTKGKAIQISAGTTVKLQSSANIVRKRQNAICAIESKGDEIGKRMTSRHGEFPDAHYGVIAKPYEYRTTLDMHVGLGAAQCGKVRVVTRYLDGGAPQSMRVWTTTNGLNENLFRGPSNDVVVLHCPAGLGLTKFKVSAGEKGRPVIAFAMQD